MDINTDTEKNIVTQKIRKKMRFLVLVVGFVIATLFSIIFAYLYRPIFSFFDFLPDLSISAILSFTFVIALLGLYLLITSSKQTIRIIEDYNLRLDRLLNITKDLREEVHSDILFEKIMDYAVSVTNSEAGALLLKDNNNELTFKIVKGKKTFPLIGPTVKIGSGLTGWAAEKGMAICIDDASKDDRFNPVFDGLAGYEPKTIMCVPLKTKEHVIGVLTLLDKKDGHHYRSRDEEIITYLADQAASSILKTQFLEDQKNYEIHLTEMLLEAIDFQLSDKKGHSRRVALYGNIMAKALNMPEKSQKKLYFASLLHDVGFLKMHSDVVFSKEELMRHPVIGYEMIKPINFYADIAPIILHHHERYDGYGYPSRLKGEEIPLAARIISIAEAFDAMTSDTSYKIPVSFEDALDEMRRNAGTQFDPDLIQIFIANILPKHVQ